MNNKNFDVCASFFLENGAFTGRFVRLNQVLEAILGKHNYPLNVSSALAETTALAALCASMLKFEGLFTLQIQGNGPVSLLVVDVTSEGKIRSCAKFDAQKLKQAKQLRKTQDVVESVAHLVGGGYMALTVDEQKGAKPYQGIIDLKGKTLTELALRYFKNSEQIDTALKLFVKTPQGESQSFLAGGILLQKVPLKGGKDAELNEDASSRIWEDITAFTNSLKPDEVFDANLSSTEILHRLFHANNLQISGTKNFSFGCRCNREKLLSALSSFEPKDIKEMTLENGNIEATCNFCSQKYVFTPDELSNFQKNLQ